MWFLIILSLSLSSYVDSISSATESSRHKRDDDSEPWNNPVLPDTIEPIHYDVYIAPNCKDSGTYFEGNVTIEINVLEKTNTFIVHSKQLTIQLASVEDKDGKDLYVRNDFDHEDYHIMRTDEFLEGRGTLTYWFDGDMTFITGSDFNRSGLYKIRYVKDDGHESWIILSDNGQNTARYIFPNFDEPRFKASFLIHILHNSALLPQSNMGLEEGYPRDVGHSTMISVFKLSPLMSSHQVSFAIFDLQKQIVEVNKTEIRVWGRLGRIDKVNYTLNVTPSILNYLQTELDIPFTIDKLDMIAVIGDLLGNHRNNWGLNIFEESKLLFNEAEEGESARYEALKVIAHSQAHNYFGNLVTCRYWRHVWLSEALTSFYEVRAVTEVDPTFRHEGTFFSQELEVVMSLEASNSTEPLILTSDSAADDLDPILVKTQRFKGAAILRMAENFLGADAFQSGIRLYLSEHANGSTVVTDDLLDALEEEASVPYDMRGIMKNWVEKPGFPLIKVELLSGNRVIATQKQFLNYNASHPNDTNKWDVPLRFKLNRRPEHMTWLTKDHFSVTIHIPKSAIGEWIEFNVDRTGYYRVNYDTELWNRLEKQLNEDHTVFTALSRAKLFSDARALIKAEELGYDVFLNLTRYASNEKDFTPWVHITQGVFEVNRIFNTTILRLLQMYIYNLTANLMEELQVKDEGTYADVQLRESIMYLSCSSRYYWCVKNASIMYEQWLFNQREDAIPKKFLYWVPCVSVLYTGPIAWEKLFQKFHHTPKSSTDARAMLLSAVSCTINPVVMETLFRRSLNSTIMSDDECIKNMEYVASNPDSENFGWGFLKSNYADIIGDKGINVSIALLQKAVQNFNTRKLYDEVVGFCENFPIPKNIVDGIKTTINSNIRWMDRNLGAITTWLETNAGSLVDQRTRPDALIH